MEIPILPTNFERSRGNVTRLPIINMFAERSLADNKIILQSRPGVDVNAVLGSVTASVRFVYSEPGVFNGDIFSVCGYDVYRNNILIGTIDGDDATSIDSFPDRLFIASGSSLWSYDGTSLSKVTVPDSLPVGKVLVGYGRAFVFIKNSQRFYWTDLLDTNINALSFAEAENSPDNVRDALIIGDSLLLFGENTTEFWTVSDEADVPFVPLIGRVYPKGVKNTGAVVKLGSSFAGVTNTSQVCISDPDNVISSPELELAIEKAATVLLWSFFLDQTEFLCVSVGNESWVHNPRTEGLWSKFETYGKGLWEPFYYANGVFGSKTTNRTLKWSEGFSDADVPILERRFRVFHDGSKPSLIVNNLVVLSEVGTTTYVIGTPATPSIEMRSSKDSGATWTVWRKSSLGVQGDYAALARWLSCGIFSYPGILFEFRVTDPVSFNALSVFINEAYGGL